MAIRGILAQKDRTGLRDFVTSGSCLRRSRILFGDANLRQNGPVSAVARAALSAEAPTQCSKNKQAAPNAAAYIHGKAEQSLRALEE
jgi:hypothetical protein